MRKKSFRNKRYTFVAKSFFETSTYLRLSIAYIVNPVGFKKNHFSLESWIKRSFTQLFTINENIDCIVLIWSHSTTSFTPIKQSKFMQARSILKGTCGSFCQVKLWKTCCFDMDVSFKLNFFQHQTFLFFCICEINDIQKPSSIIRILLTQLWSRKGRMIM